MCGFAGRIGATPIDLDRALASIRHRGPDDTGTYAFHRDDVAVDLGFVRLSILDLPPPGHQPMSNEDGTANEYPSITVVNQEILDYWATRAKEAKNPVLKARYADLVWELSKPATGESADVSMAQITIDSNIEIAEKDAHEHEVHVVTKLERALGDSRVPRGT